MDWECDPRLDECDPGHPYNPTTTTTTKTTTSTTTKTTIVTTTTTADFTTHPKVTFEPQNYAIARPEEPSRGPSGGTIINFNPVLQNNIGDITVSANSSNEHQSSVRFDHDLKYLYSRTPKYHISDEQLNTSDESEDQGQKSQSEKVMTPSLKKVSTSV